MDLQLCLHKCSTMAVPVIHFPISKHFNTKVQCHFLFLLSVHNGRTGATYESFGISSHYPPFSWNGGNFKNLLITLF